MAAAPIALIGGAVVDVLGISPVAFGESIEANWAKHAVFDSEMVFQPVSGGEHVETLNLACRPHVYGGLENYRLLQTLCRTRASVPFIRMSGLVGSYFGLVAVQRVSREESRFAPDGAGWRWEFTAELIYLGLNIGGGF